MPMQRPRGAIFDLDGTLIDSLDDIFEAVNIGLFHTCGGATTRDFVRRSIGDGLRNLCARVAPNFSPERLTVLCERVGSHYRAHHLDRTRLYDGVAPMLRALYARHIPLAVLSNKPDEFTRSIVTALCGTETFTMIRGVTRDDERKPAPRGALEVARGLQLAPADVALIGDSEVDIQTARAAGMMAVAVTWGFRDEAELRSAEPDWIAGEPGDIVRLFGE